MTKNDARFFETHPHRVQRDYGVSYSRSQFDRFREEVRKFGAGEEERFKVKTGELVLLE